MGTVEYERLLELEELKVFLDAAEAAGTVPTAAIAEIAEAHVLDELELDALDGAEKPRAPGSTTLRDALSLMVTTGSRSVVVVAEDGQPKGVVTLDVLAELER